MSIFNRKADDSLSYRLKFFKGEFIEDEAIAIISSYKIKSINDTEIHSYSSKENIILLNEIYNVQ